MQSALPGWTNRYKYGVSYRQVSSWCWTLLNIVKLLPSRRLSSTHLRLFTTEDSLVKSTKEFTSFCCALSKLSLQVAHFQVAGAASCIYYIFSWWVVDIDLRTNQYVFDNNTCGNLMPMIRVCRTNCSSRKTTIMEFDDSVLVASPDSGGHDFYDPSYNHDAPSNELLQWTVLLQWGCLVGCWREWMGTSGLQKCLNAMEGMVEDSSRD